VANTGTVLGLVCSPNRDGRTFNLVRAALTGAAAEGATVELIQVADQVVSACRDCQPWVCLKTLHCSYPDPAFEYVAEKLLTCGALVLGTPVYWWDTSAMFRLLMLKMFRVYARSAPLAGLPAVGIGVAGGTGNGLVSGLRPVYHFFQMLQMRALAPLPVTRFNWDRALVEAGERGAKLASMANQRHPFAGLEDRLLWYDALPHLSMTRSAERRLLASQTTQSLPAGALLDVGRSLAEADELAAQGELLRSLELTTSVYERTLEVFETSTGR
jgi:multimeric flavodoxin WrbA